MSAMVYWLLVPVRLSGNPSQQRRTTLSRLSSTSIPTLNQTQPAKNSRPVLFSSRCGPSASPPSTKMRTAADDSQAFPRLDMSEEEWAFVAPYLALLSLDARQRRHDLRI